MGLSRQSLAICRFLRGVLPMKHRRALQSSGEDYIFRREQHMPSAIARSLYMQQLRVHFPNGWRQKVFPPRTLSFSKEGGPSVYIFSQIICLYLTSNIPNVKLLIYPVGKTLKTRNPPCATVRGVQILQCLHQGVKG